MITEYINLKCRLIRKLSLHKFSTSFSFIVYVEHGYFFQEFKWIGHPFAQFRDITVSYMIMPKPDNLKWIGDV